MARPVRSFGREPRLLEVLVVGVRDEVRKARHQMAFEPPARQRLPPRLVEPLLLELLVQVYDEFDELVYRLHLLVAPRYGAWVKSIFCRHFPSSGLSGSWFYKP